MKNLILPLLIFTLFAGTAVAAPNKPIELLSNGAGNSGKTPKGLETAKGIQKNIELSISNLSATTTASSTDIQVTFKTNKEASGSVFYYQGTTTPTTTVDSVNFTDNKNHSVTIGSIASNTQYSIYVYAEDEYGNSTTSETIVIGSARDISVLEESVQNFIQDNLTSIMASQLAYHDANGKYEQIFATYYPQYGIWFETFEYVGPGGEGFTLRWFVEEPYYLIDTLTFDNPHLDVTAPALVSVNTETVEIPSGQDTYTAVRITVEALDDIVGLGGVGSVRLKSPSGNYNIVFGLTGELGTNIRSEIFDSGFPESGTWTIESFKVSDIAGNVTQYFNGIDYTETFEVANTI